MAVHFRNLTFWDLLPARLHARPTANNFDNFGTYGRLDGALLVRELHRAGGLPAGVEPSTFLYTDTDVMFVDDPVDELLAMPRPTLFAAAADELGPGCNMGIMYCSTAGMEGIKKGLLAYGQSRGFKFGNGDQTMVNNYFRLNRLRWQTLPATLNRRAVLSCLRQQSEPEGTAKVAGNGTQMVTRAPLRLWSRGLAARAANGSAPCAAAQVWHWHGAKPRDVRCWFGKFDKSNLFSTATDATASCPSPISRGLLRRYDACYLVRYARLLDLWAWWERQLVQDDGALLPAR